MKFPLSKIFKKKAEIEGGLKFISGKFTFRVAYQERIVWLEVKVTSCGLVVRKYQWSESMFGEKQRVLVNLRGAWSIPLLTEIAKIVNEVEDAIRKEVPKKDIESEELRTLMALAEKDFTGEEDETKKT